VTGTADGTGRLLIVNADDVRRECSAQLDRLEAAGLQLTHLDAHQHLHLWPSVAGVTVDLAVERGIPAPASCSRRVRSTACTCPLPCGSTPR
jgi:predicted glycoside hydrolase/deacetylase ChbG (UPF0249 family)